MTMMWKRWPRFCEREGSGVYVYCVFLFCLCAVFPPNTCQLVFARVSCYRRKGVVMMVQDKN
jgi:hypothetical protein